MKYLEAIPIWPWSMAAALLSLVSVSILVWVNFIRPGRRRRLLRSPFDAHFIIHNKRHPYACDYAVQDDYNHAIKEIVVSVNSKIVVDLVMQSKTDFQCTEFYVGCDGEFAAKPRAIEYFNRFVRQGRAQRVVPGQDGTNDYTDVYDYYHRAQPRTFSAGTPIAVAFNIETRSPGGYPFNINVVGTESRGEVRGLWITVEDHPVTPMRCTLPEHRELSCANIGVVPLFEYRAG